MTTVDYTIIEKVDPSDLARCVQSALANGWLPQGGVAVTALGDDEYLYCQAMVRVE